MTTRAIFVVSSSGRWRDESGASKGISNERDLEHLKASRAWSHVIVSSGETVRTNRYSPTRKPLKIFSQSDERHFSKLASEGNTEILHGSVPANLAKIKNEFENVLIEFGPTLLKDVMSEHLVDEFDLSIVGAFNMDDLRELIAGLPFQLSFSDYEILEQGPDFAICRFYL